MAGRKERRRFSLLSCRKFLGDYLGVGLKDSLLGNELRTICDVEGWQRKFSHKCPL